MTVDGWSPSVHPYETILHCYSMFYTTRLTLLYVVEHFLYSGHFNNINMSCHNSLCKWVRVQHYPHIRGMRKSYRAITSQKYSSHCEPVIKPKCSNNPRMRLTKPRAITKHSPLPWLPTASTIEFQTLLHAVYCKWQESTLHLALSQHISFIRCFCSHIQSFTAKWSFSTTTIIEFHVLS